ncbi:MBL fold metallo-hydrolase [Leifsonia sp. NPDC058248]|uniref:MBL fold metallo-hydrolase n=1 Tax=Leifsonia sp. NPDC058248 TaxID=3346402 RepID=UPI0036D9D329
MPTSIAGMTGPEQLRPGIHIVPIAMPGGPIPYSLCYLIEDDRGGVHVVDPGWSSDENEERLSAAFESIGHTIDDVAQIVITHLHADHLGGADRLRTASGATLVMHAAEQTALDAPAPAPPLEAWGVPTDRRAELDLPRTVPRLGRPADRLVTHGDELAVPGRRLRVLHTPGHTAGHICLDEPDAGLVFTGDHVLPTINSGLGLGGASDSNPIADYLGSLRRVAVLDDREACPGHERPFRGLAERSAALAEHQLERAREVAGLLRTEPDATVWRIASGLTWTAGWPDLAGFALLSALSQTALHRDFVLSGEYEDWQQPQ